MQALFFFAGGTLCAARMEAITHIWSRAEVRVEGGRVSADGETWLAALDLPMRFTRGARQVRPDVNYIVFNELPGHAVRVDQILTRAAFEPGALHLLPPFVFAAGCQDFTHLLDMGEFLAFLIAPSALTRILGEAA